MTVRNWNAVARTISARARELELSQLALAERSQVASATIRELQYNTVQRRRNTRTLEALSVALELHPGHLFAILTGRTPPSREPPPLPPLDPLARLHIVEQHVLVLRQRLDEIHTALNPDHPNR
ncbi:XRE family transcriptional regulator [Actinokineospora globicatena]|uniref:Uncharacterized protein n=1 Tax=Actinokineospora globicatena TaxID=103729 RepID=A0A9W6V5F7_9PSEU|nr:XRE family transcriptional regulator [Actinokineospora globicatena]GLW90290.1 hypothetical protein Aglo03_11060 [Actinokineospora globicatena]